MSARRVTLTFDNGPVPGVTEAVLEILERAGIRSTFFVIGRNLDKPAKVDLMQRAHASGHWIGNHTLSHTIALGDRPERDYALSEIERAQERIGSFAHAEKLFRPYGNSGRLGPHLFSRAAVDHLVALNYRTVIWNNVPGDWRDPEGWVERCIAQVTTEPWSVIVLHDIEGGCRTRLPELLRRLDDLGVAFEQDFPDTVTLTRGGKIASFPQEYVAD